VVAEEVDDDVAEAGVDGCFCSCYGSHTAILSRQVNAKAAGPAVPRSVKSAVNRREE
jgi:hypothetical protein